MNKSAYLDEKVFKNRLRRLMEMNNLATARDLAKALYDNGNITVEVGEFDDGSIAINSMARRIQDHLNWDTADKLQGRYVTAYCDYFHCSADYLFGRTPLKSGNPSVIDFCESTYLSEKAVKRLIEEIPEDIKIEMTEFWSNVIESNIFYKLPLEYRKMCSELGQYQTAIKQIGDIDKASQSINDSTSFVEIWRTMMTDNYLKEAEPHKGAYFMHLNEILDNVKIYLDIWSNEYITKRKRDIEAEFTDALERKHRKSKEEFMKKMNQWNDDLEGET